MKEQWQYYNHALVPSGEPHISLTEESLKKSNLWKNKNVLFARWTSDYDCGYETNWWYCIKDEPFDITEINAKKRYEINKGNKNFTVSHVVKTTEYLDEIYDVYVSALKSYGDKVNTDREQFKVSMSNMKNIQLFVAFSKEDNKLCA